MTVEPMRRWYHRPSGRVDLATARTQPEAGKWEILASFPDLRPDPSFDDRMAQPEKVANRHGSQYQGSHR
jgi:hypothetical protein